MIHGTIKKVECLLMLIFAAAAAWNIGIKTVYKRQIQLMIIFENFIFDV